MCNEQNNESAWYMYQRDANFKNLAYEALDEVAFQRQRKLQKENEELLM